LSDDGYPSGVLKSVDVGKDGGITGYFTNGQTSQLGKILLANFPDAGELKKWVITLPRPFPVDNPSSIRQAQPGWGR